MSSTHLLVRLPSLPVVLIVGLTLSQVWLIMIAPQTGTLDLYRMNSRNSLSCLSDHLLSIGQTLKKISENRLSVYDGRFG